MIINPISYNPFQIIAHNRSKAHSSIITWVRVIDFFPSRTLMSHRASEVYSMETGPSAQLVYAALHFKPQRSKRMEHLSVFSIVKAAPVATAIHRVIES